MMDDDVSIKEHDFALHDYIPWRVNDDIIVSIYTPKGTWLGTFGCSGPGVLSYVSDAQENRKIKQRDALTGPEDAEAVTSPEFIWLELKPGAERRGLVKYRKAR